MIRGALFVVFVAFPISQFSDRLARAFIAPSLGLGAFLFTLAIIAGLIAVITLSHGFGYLAFLASLASGLLFNPSPWLFCLYVVVGLLFSEGISSLKPYDSVARGIRFGMHENVSSNLHLCLKRHTKTFLLVGVGLVVVSSLYALLPDVLHLATNITALATYASIGLIAIAITVMHFGRGEIEEGRL